MAESFVESGLDKYVPCDESARPCIFVSSQRNFPKFRLLQKQCGGRREVDIIAYLGWRDRTFAVSVNCLGIIQPE